MTIIPAIDIIDGKCVRLTRGDYDLQTIYNEDPVSVAMQFEDAGLKRLHLMDLDGARMGDVQNWKVLEKIARNTHLVIDFSGGISSSQNLETCFNAGAAFAAIGSLAVTGEALLTSWLFDFGADRFIIAADVSNERIMIKGWTEETTYSVYDLIERYRLKGVQDFFCTDINKDGLLAGPSIDLYKKILNRHPSIDLIASGGVSSTRDLEELRESGCSGAIIGKALYENKISLEDLQKFI